MRDVSYALPTECFSICVICFDGCMIDLQHRPCHLCLHPGHLFFLIYLHRSIHLLRRINLHLLRHCTVKKNIKRLLLLSFGISVFKCRKLRWGCGVRGVGQTWQMPIHQTKARNTAAVEPQGRRNVFQSGGAQWRNIWGGGGGGAIFARERSDRGAGASIQFSDWGGGQKL